MTFPEPTPWNGPQTRWDNEPEPETLCGCHGGPIQECPSANHPGETILRLADGRVLAFRHHEPALYLHVPAEHGYPCDLIGGRCSVSVLVSFLADTVAASDDKLATMRRIAEIDLGVEVTR